MITHELWAAAQLTPGEGIEDGVSRIENILSRIDAERGKEAVGYDALFNAIADATNADAVAVTISVRMFEESIGGKLFLSPTPTIPDEVSYHNAPGCLNTGDKAMWTIGWNACRDAMLAAQGERKC